MIPRTPAIVKCAQTHAAAVFEAPIVPERAQTRASSAPYWFSPGRPGRILEVREDAARSPSSLAADDEWPGLNLSDFAMSAEPRRQVATALRTGARGEIGAPVVVKPSCPALRALCRSVAVVDVVVELVEGVLH